MTLTVTLPVVKTAIQIRHSDIDSLGHVSNTVYPHYLEQARIDFFHAVRQLGHCPATRLTRLTIDIVGEIVYGDDIYVMSWCTELAGEHIVINQHIVVNAPLTAADQHHSATNKRIVTKGVINLTGYDYRNRNTVAFPAEWIASAAEPV